MNVKEVFLELTKKTAPKGYEMKNIRPLLPDFLQEDAVGNLYHIIGETDIIFNAHLDTYDKVGNDANVTHIIDDHIIKTDGKTILGADDKAGVVILLYMIEKGIPGNYIFFMGEEKGCEGSGKLTKWMQGNKKNIWKNVKKVISFDRMGYESVITHQTDQRCCSDDFADALIEQFNSFGFRFKKDPTGMYSDSAEFADIVPECTNLSVGYFNQHTFHETQDILFLEKMAETCCKINWATLPIKRDPSKAEFIDSYYGYDKETNSLTKSYIKDDLDDTSKTISDIDSSKIKINYFYDKKYKYLSDVSFEGDVIIDLNIAYDRVVSELDEIEKLIQQYEIEYDGLKWDGFILIIEKNNHDTKLTRNELISYLPILELNKIEGYIEYGNQQKKGKNIHQN